MESTHLDDAFAKIQSKGFSDSIDAAIILGTGLGSTIEGMDPLLSLPYDQLPGFPADLVPGHQGELVIGKIENATVACLLGRTHYYQSGRADGMSVPLELMALMGAQHIIITNSAGSVNADLAPGSLALITDHINMGGPNPLIGANADDGFISLVNAYNERINRRFKLAASAGGVTLREGIYMWFSGPTFETPAEIRMARVLGADMIGMSTVPETIIARRLGLNVTGISAISNYGAGFRSADPSHHESQTVARQAAIVLRRLLKAFFAAADRPA